MAELSFVNVYEFLSLAGENGAKRGRERPDRRTGPQNGEGRTMLGEERHAAIGAAADTAVPPFVLRPPHLGDVVPYTNFLADSAVSLWLDDSAQRPLSTGRVESLLLRDGWCLWSIEVDGAFVGVTSLYEPDMARQAARFSIVVGDRRQWNRGLGTAVARAVMRHGFAELGLRKIVSDYLEPNAASARLHVRCGFTVEGRLREDAWRQGRWVDRLWLSLLKSEWESGAAAPR